MMNAKTAMGRVLAVRMQGCAVAGAARKRFFVAVAMLAAWVSAGFGGIRVDWNNHGWMVEAGADVNEGPGIAENNIVIWQLIYAGANGKADEVDLNAPDYLGGDDVLLAVREIPMGGGTAADGTEWDGWMMYQGGGSTVYENLSWLDEGYFFQRVYQGWPCRYTWYYESDLVGLHLGMEDWLPQNFELDPTCMGLSADRNINDSPHYSEHVYGEETIGDVRWWWNYTGEGTAEVYRGRPAEGTLNIPSEIPVWERRAYEWVDEEGGWHEDPMGGWWEISEYYTVTGIGSNAFSGCLGLTSITIPNSVTNIGARAFSGCSGLTNVVLPTGGGQIGEDAFSGCRGLTSLTIPDGVQRIEKGAFSGCIGLKEVEIPQSFGAENLYAIFADSCETISTVRFRYGVRSIGYGLFSGCSGLKEVSIPASVTSIGSGAFDGCPAAVFDVSSIPGIRLVDGWAIDAEDSDSLPVDLDLTRIRGIADSAFSRCRGVATLAIPQCICSAGLPRVFPNAYDAIRTVTIGSGVTSIGTNAFSGCRGILSVKIPASVKSIGASAFLGCSSLASVRLPEGMTRIEDSVFAGCNGLTSMTIPSGVTSIGASAFSGCSRLTSLTIPVSVTNIGPNAFSGSGLSLLVLPTAWEGTDKLSAAGLPAGCTVRYVDGNPALSIAPTRKHFDVEGGAGAIVTTGSGNWEAFPIDSWLTLNSATGQVGYPVVYMVEAATDAEPRSGVIYVSGYPYTVTQDGLGAGISPASGTFERDGGSGTISVEVSDKAVWQARANDSWLDVTQTGGTGPGMLTYTVEAFDKVNTRQGTLTVAGNMFSVCQYGRRMKLGSYSAAQNYNSHTISVEVEALDITEWSVTPNADWISVMNAGSGKGNGQVNIAIAENPSWKSRTGTVNIGTETFTVMQEGRTELEFAIDPEGATATAEWKSGVITVTATPDLPWTAESGVEWLRVLPVTAKGAGNGKVEYSVSSNPTLYGRTGTITVMPGDEKVGAKSHEVKQAAAQSALSLDGYEFAADGDSCEVRVSVSDIVKWSIENTNEWLKVEGNAYRMGAGTVTLQALSNETVYPRNGMVIIARKSFKVSQKGRGLEVEYDSKLFGRDGGFDTIAIHPEGNVLWTAVSSDLTWLSIAGESSGTGEGQIMYVVSQCVGEGTVRTATITVGDKVVYITQRAYDLSIDPREAWVNGTKGAGELGVSAGSGDAWTATVTVPWITLVEGCNAGTGSGTVRFLYAGNDTGEAREGKIIVAGEVFTLRQRVREAAFPDVETDEGVAEALSGAADARLGEKLSNVEEYGDFRAWMDDKGLDPKDVQDSEHAWASYVLGAEALFENEPTIQIGGLSSDGGAEGSRAAGASWEIRVTVKDGENVVAVDADKVAALFECTGDIGDWVGDAKMDASVRKTGEEGDVLVFEVTPGTGKENRAFVRIGE